MSKLRRFTNPLIDTITISFGLQNLGVQQALDAGTDTASKLKNVINRLFGVTTGLNLFSDAQQYQQHLGFEGILNQQTYAGIAALIYNAATKVIPALPLKAESKRFGASNLSVGIATGIFRDSSQGTSPSSGISVSTSSAQIIGEA